ncbi:hypothetical protein ACP70R_011397 [Stipagrostis hirtigluma subsp. patula]
MRIQCDACEGAAATVVCCADEAALCARCDVQVHAANKLAGKHQRLPIEHAGGGAAGLPRCDVCQERPAFVFCVEDRALFCRDCDEPIHVPGTLSGGHQRYLATGIRVGFSSVCGANATTHADSLPPPKGGSKPVSAGAGAGAGAATNTKTPVPAAQEVPLSPILSPPGWAVEDLLQLSDYESSDKKESPLGFKELEWFADIDLFHGQAPASTAAEVPELFASPQPASNAAFYKTSSARHSKKPRLELPDDEDYFIVPDLG